MSMHKPNLQCYWALPGRLLAGEYPRERDDDTSINKLLGYLNAGIYTFVDLTEPDELAPYASMLRTLASQHGVDIRHHRFSIPDKSVPPSIELMHNILQTIHSELGDNRNVYVHCWGGVGRTGTVIGCYLVERGLAPIDALQCINLLWQGVEKVARHPQLPETEAQREWVKNWRPSFA